jgi:glycosyltransferase involved in cell wall biosynthesis
VKPCLVIPCFEHAEPLAGVLATLEPLGLPCVVVDDGSSPVEQERLAALARRHPWARVLRRAHNGGRGAALRDGYREAARLGHTHVLQLDADGQHDGAHVPRFLTEAEREPRALVLGAPVFDASVPKGRLVGRQLSRGWVWIETRSFAVRDPLCGMRCFPLAPLLRVLEAHDCGDRMEFDVEVLVRLVWEGLPVVNVDVPVRYAPGGVSHFRLWDDNVRISRAHARLFVASLARRMRR